MWTSRLVTGSHDGQALFHLLILFAILALLPLRAMDDADLTPDKAVLG